MPSVKHRRHPKTGKWNIRFRTKGRPEIVETYAATISEETIINKVIWYREQLDLGRYDPWQERREKEEKRGKFKLYFDQAIEKYITEGKNSGRWRVNGSGKCRTADTNRQRLEWLMKKVGNIPATDIGKAHIQGYLMNGAGNAYSKKSILSSINTFMKWLYHNGHAETLVQGELPKAIKDHAMEIERDVRGITLYQLKRLCVGLRIRNQQLAAEKFAGHWKDRDWAIEALPFVFAFMLRREEINKIYPADISRDLSKITIGNLKSSWRKEFIPKGGIRTIPATKLMRKILVGMDVHSRPARRPIIDRNPDQVYRKLKEACWIVFPDERIRLHDLRHGGIMHYRSKGWPDSLVGMLARHASSNVTAKIYGGIDAAEIKRTLDTYDL